MTQGAAQWARVKALFAEALNVEPERRRQWAEAACAGDTELCREVLDLLASHQDAGGFLHEAALDGGLRVPEDEAPPDTAFPALGPYRVLDLVGQGGMGTVLRAVRADDQYEKQVAIKLVRRGLDTSEALGRFRLERRLLARLEHPGIARLLDAGSAPDGRPYFVMEYVEGLRIDRWCDERRLDTRAVLELFLAVSAAVQHAHQSLVVHRDLKPANILVTRDGIPKLLDFGIAKLLDPSDTEGATATAFPALTPDYASPEQIRGEPVSTASDVYALGVLLYELLTGRRPYRLTSRTREEIGRAVCEQEPDPPSVVADLDTSRGPGAAKRRRALAGDLDTIVLKALRKEPERRYPSVEAMAEDVRRHLSGRPVQARPDSFTYRTTKFVRRNRLAVSAAAVVVLSLLGGIVATTRQARITRAERARAERRFGEVRQLAHALLFDIHDAVQTAPGTTAARALIVSKALEYLDTLAGEAQDDPALQRELAVAYIRVGDVQGGGGKSTANLGDQAAALQSYRKALAIEEHIAATDADPKQRSELMNAHSRIARVLSDQGDVEGARRAYGAAISVAESVSEPRPPVLRVALADTYLKRAETAAASGRSAESVEDARRAADLYSVLLAEAPDDREAQRNAARAYQLVARTLQRTGELEGALAAFERARTVRETHAAAEPANALHRRALAVVVMETAGCLAQLGRAREAVPLYRQASATLEDLVAVDRQNANARRDLAGALRFMGEALLDAGEPQAARAAGLRSVALFEGLVAGDPKRVDLQHGLAEARTVAGTALEACGEPAAADRQYAAEADAAEALSTQHPETPAGLMYLAEARAGRARVAASRNDLPRATAEMARAVEAADALLARDSSHAAFAGRSAGFHARLADWRLRSSLAPADETCRMVLAHARRARELTDGQRFHGSLSAETAALLERLQPRLAACAARPSPAVQ
jgi:non-specific serine/threonine protein kinase/serine/threonine-protein kinase